MQPLAAGDDELIKAARGAVLPLVDQRFEGERITSVGAAARWQDGKVFAGANVRHPSSPASCTCAELVTLGMAYNTTHNRDLDVIVAYWYESDGQENIINPCGRCRDYLRLYDNPWLIVRNGSITKSKEWGRIRLNDLHPLTNSWEDLAVAPAGVSGIGLSGLLDCRMNQGRSLVRPALVHSSLRRVEPRADLRFPYSGEWRRIRDSNS